MSRHSPLEDEERLAMAAVRDRFPARWRTIVLRVWDGERPAGTASLLTPDMCATLRRLRNMRGVTWLGSYRP